MPTVQITVCSTCGKKSCDGGIWKIIQVKRISDGSLADVSKMPRENVIACTLGNGRGHHKLLKGCHVGAKIQLTYLNWVKPSYVTIEKIED